MWGQTHQLIRFPDPRNAHHDIIVVGGALNAANLVRAYRRGIFPWPVEGWPLTWFCPAERAILDFKDLHVPRTLRQAARRTPFRFTIDQDFPAVIRHCAEAKRQHETGTWITPQMIHAYTELHRLGHAHSVEAWEGDRLVGGLYGVDAGGAFAGESMFYLRPDASKLALLYLVERLRARAAKWLDIQVLTPHMEALGAKAIPREEFLDRLAATRARGLNLFGDAD
ncbi:MAG: leucyl/phenylalanyl-tRNA--protein transferase [Pyrinomonadaceae bacterium]